MRIISLNVNNFGGKSQKPLLEDYKKNEQEVDWDEWKKAVDEWRCNYECSISNNVDSIVNIISDYEVVFLHEVDTNCFSWNRLREKMENEDYKFEMPNGKEEEDIKRGKMSISCAFIKNNITYECSCRNSFGEYMRNVELQFGNTIIIGLHMNYKKDMWSSFEKLAKNNAKKNALIIGDLNVCDEDTERKKVLNSLIESGWEDIWTYQGDDKNTPTCDTEKRIDYVLATKSIVTCGVREIIINAIRRQEISDHAAIIALLYGDIYNIPIQKQ